MENVGKEGSRPEPASRTIVSMSLRLAIPRRVGLHQSPLPLRQPIASLRERSHFEKNNSSNGRCSYRKMSHGRGPPQQGVDEIVAAQSLHFPNESTGLNKFVASA